MEDEERDEGERPRPRVVDKRVSARSQRAPEPTAPPSEPVAPVSAASPGPAGARAAPPFEQPPTTEAPGANPSTVQAPPAEPPPGPVATEGEPDPSAPIWTPEQEEEARRLVEEIAQVPSREWVTDTAVRLANIGGVKIDRGDLADAQLAIDALEGLVNAAGTRLADAERPLRQTIAQLQMAYVQASQAPQS
jgi:hypothetical protein